MRRLVVGVLVYSVTSLVAVALAQARLLTGTLLTSLMTNLMMELVGMGTVLGLACLGLVVVGVRHLLPFMCPRCEQPFFHPRFRSDRHEGAFAPGLVAGGLRVRAASATG